MKRVIMSLALTAAVLGLTACTSTSGKTQEDKDAIKMVFYPNESATEFEESRAALQEIISEATDRQVEVVTTTDYNVAIESIVNGQADLAFMGAEGYIQANKKNDQVQALVVSSGESGTLDDALYYSFIAVPDAAAKEYEVADGYSLAPLKGKAFSFVSNSSTSGFKVPASALVKQFDLTNSDELIMEGDVFSKVLYGGSHQGSAVNLLKGDADGAAFMNMPEYFDVIDGEENKAGMLYQVKADAEAPFDTVQGKQARIIQATPVLNGPIVANEETLSDKELAAIKEAMTAESTSENTAIFAPKDSGTTPLFEKKGQERFLEVEDSFYDPIRELSE